MPIASMRSGRSGGAVGLLVRGRCTSHPAHAPKSVWRRAATIASGNWRCYLRDTTPSASDQVDSTSMAMGHASPCSQSISLGGIIGQTTRGTRVDWPLFHQGFIGGTFSDFAARRHCVARARAAPALPAIVTHPPTLVPDKDSGPDRPDLFEGLHVNLTSAGELSSTDRCCLHPLRVSRSVTAFCLHTRCRCLLADSELDRLLLTPAAHEPLQCCL